VPGEAILRRSGIWLSLNSVEEFGMTTLIFIKCGLPDA
jgi:hypothetical protein